MDAPHLCRAWTRARHQCKGKPIRDGLCIAHWRAFIHKQAANETIKIKAHQKLLIQDKRHELSRKQRLGAHYRIGLHAQLLEQQSGLCAICQRPLTKPEGHMDHDHNTQRMRGILCVTCNIRLGVIEKAGFPHWLGLALAYLDRFSSRICDHQQPTGR